MNSDIVPGGAPMARRRGSARFRIGVIVAGVTAGALLTAAPRAGQQPGQLPDRQGRERSSQVQGPGAPTIAVPRITAPSISVPTIGAGQQLGVTRSPWMNAARADAIVQAYR